LSIGGRRDDRIGGCPNLGMRCPWCGDGEVIGGGGIEAVEGDGVVGGGFGEQVPEVAAVRVGAKVQHGRAGLGRYPGNGGTGGRHVGDGDVGDGGVLGRGWGGAVG